MRQLSMCRFEIQDSGCCAFVLLQLLLFTWESLSSGPSVDGSRLLRSTASYDSRSNNRPRTGAIRLVEMTVAATPLYLCMRSRTASNRRLRGHIKGASLSVRNYYEAINAQFVTETSLVIVTRATIVNQIWCAAMVLTTTRPVLTLTNQSA